jgi:hypothetical protein
MQVATKPKYTMTTVNCNASNYQRIHTIIIPSYIRRNDFDFEWLFVDIKCLPPIAIVEE